MEVNLKQDYKKLFKLSWPIFLESLLRIMLGNIDIFMLNRFDEKAVAAVGMVYTIIAFLVMLFFIVGSGISVLISQNLGAGKKETADKLASNSIITSLIFGIVVSILLAFTIKPVINGMKLDAQVTEYAITYFIVFGSFCFINSLSCTLSAILRSYGYTKVPMFISLITNILNVGGNYIAIFGLWIIPSSGVAGVAYATVISQLIGVVIMFLMIKKYSIRITIKSLFKIDFSLLKKILSIGGSIGALRIFMSISLTIITVIISRIGYQAMNAHIYVRMFIRYVLIFSSSIQQGLLIITGNLVGAGEFKRAYKLANNVLRITLIFAVIALIAISFNLNFLLQFLTTDQTTINLAIQLGLIALFLDSFRTLNLVLLGPLRGAGDVHYLIYTGIPRLGAVILAYFFAFHFNFGVAGVWIAMGLDEFVRMVIILSRWLSKKWEKKAVVKTVKASLRQ